MRKILILFVILLCGALTVAVCAQTCSEQPVSVTRHSIPSAALHTDLMFDVYAPPCMDDRITGGYPVIYLLHGQDMGIEIWQDMKMDKIIRDTINEAGLPLFYTVVPQEDQFLLSPSISGYETALLNELIPWIDEHYNTCTDRSCRGIGGLSRGAMWAEKIAFEPAETFGALGMLSVPGAWIDQQTLYYLAQDHAAADTMLRVRIDSGSQDQYRNDGVRAATDLTFISYPYDYYVRPGEHDETYWQESLSDYFIWFSKSWKTVNLP